MEEKAKQRYENMVQRLQEQGCRLTPQRLAVLQVLASGQEHPTVEEIHQVVLERFPTTSLATVYKTVTLLRELGEVRALGYSEGSNRYDGFQPQAHPHMYCRCCGAIMDPELPQMEAFLQAVAEHTGFMVEDYQVDFFGVCNACQREVG